jgi:probable rRNA maturation factor
MKLNLHVEVEPEETGVLHRRDFTALTALFAKEYEISLKIVSEAESKALNLRFRGKDHPTNILAFPFDEDTPYLGDLALCHRVVVREAQEQHKPLKHHYFHMVIHGVLHLLGYDHIDDHEAEAMERVETEFLAKLAIPNPYKES